MIKIKLEFSFFGVSGMSGHNKWSQIKHKKAKEDAKRGAAFTKVVKEITVIAKDGGGDPATNARLRTLIEKAKEINMPLENITRAIKRGTGELPGVSYEQFTYEGYGPQGSAVMVDTLSDNKNRTVAELRRIFSQKGGSLGETGSVGWMFSRLGVIHVCGETTEEKLLDLLLELDVYDLTSDQEAYTILCDPKSLDAIKKKIEQANLRVEEATLEWIPKSTVTLTDEQMAQTVEFLTILQDHDDVQNVYANVT